MFLVERVPNVLPLVVVSPNYRKKGIASKLITEVETQCKTQKVFTSTNQSNYLMKKLCRRLGYNECGLIEGLDESDPEIFFMKNRI
ncbi:GNAT family N-acetyltransferase [Jeotgalibacillus marinus]|uniref:GNAT family N-acetyltransferase n=1 Tax=Jeotgalibacillus marinus TaxID=86667 RepID=A0ABV3Q5X3_9BACL